jgi:tripartite-type tricarboxylate transporter receptor subunit TctC
MGQGDQVRKHQGGLIRGAVENIQLERVMKPPRRKFLHLVAGGAALLAISHLAWAQTYPTRPVRLVVGFPPGGAADLISRLIGQWLSDRLGQSVFIENRAGAASNIATEFVVHATPDGYTLLDFTSTNSVVPGYVATGWQGIGAPAKTPAAIVDKLNKEVNAALADPKFTARLVDLGYEPFASSPAEFAKFVVEYTEKWSKVIRAAGIKAE